ncbi:anosmin-1-like [Petromyzon marinus]|uniref:anosmin-1-like n=1 Tax=Petromyzon marinus TaxID=7757 RepID=UPI003F71354B
MRAALLAVLATLAWAAESGAAQGPPRGRGRLMGDTGDPEGLGDPGDPDPGVREARCSARCLSLHTARLVAAFAGDLQDPRVMSWCQANRRCQQCMQPCQPSWDTNSTSCHKICESRYECSASCEFAHSLLSSSSSARPGSCAPPARARGFAAACVAGCRSDADCPAPRKCCPNGCGRTCQAPRGLYAGVPLRPRPSLSLRESPDGDAKGVSLLVSWSSPARVSVATALHVLQAQQQGHGTGPPSPWRTVAMTPGENVLVLGLRPARWFRFRVAAVNAHGTRGFTPPSAAYRSSLAPSPPPPPSPYVEWFGRSADGGLSLAAHLAWNPAADTDLPIARYKLFYGRPRTTATGERHQRLAINGSARHVTLQPLKPDSDYVVQMQALSEWGQRSLKSSKVVLTFRTPPLDSSAFATKLLHKDGKNPSTSESSSFSIANGNWTRGSDWLPGGTVEESEKQEEGGVENSLSESHIAPHGHDKSHAHRKDGRSAMGHHVERRQHRNS